MHRLSSLPARLKLRKLNYSTNAQAPDPPGSNATGALPNTPPSYFHNGSKLPEKLEAAPSEVNGASANGPVETTQTPPSRPASPPPPPPVPPKALFAKQEEPVSPETGNYFNNYKEFCKGMAYLGVGMGVVFFMFEQHERLDESERKMRMMKKKQKELVVQMQTYKNKLTRITADNAKNTVMLQGKMQMHIALLRQQLLESGIEPVKIDEAIQRFQEDVKVDITANSVELWVPGEKEIKRLIPDPHEYNKRK